MSEEGWLVTMVLGGLLMAFGVVALDRCQDREALKTASAAYKACVESGRKECSMEIGK